MGENILWNVFMYFGDMLFDASFFEFTFANRARNLKFDYKFEIP